MFANHRFPSPSIRCADVIDTKARPVLLLARILLPMVLVLIANTGADAQVKLPNVFGEHMVLQREKPIKIWGWAEPTQTIVVTLGEASSNAAADTDGYWQVQLPAMKAGGPFKMTVGLKDQPPTIKFNDILIGEVWVCSGQSNMQWTVSASKDAQQEIANGNHPMIRHIGAPRVQSNRPETDVNAKWTVCSPETVGQYTAVGYYFARTLHQRLEVPIGLVNSSWGGTRVEPWTPPVGFADVPALAAIDKQVKLVTPGSPERTARLKQHFEATEAWLNDAKSLMKVGDFVKPQPPFPAELTPNPSHQAPTKLYNAMIHPYLGMPIRGAIWYQGESNHNEGMMYFEKKKALINGWRKLWDQGDFPFYFVQIAPYHYGNEDPTILAEFWEAQEKVTELKNTGMVVISDIGNLRDIHPRNKQDVGARLAAFALKNDYGKNVIAGSPKFESMEIGEGKLMLTFSNVGEGLKTNDGQELSHFEVAGKKKSFRTAKATIKGKNQIELKSDDIESPVAMRFAWNKLAEPNLVNTAGIPASAFRAGKPPTGISSVPGSEDYRVVYETDFSSLGQQVGYLKDNHQSVGEFSRVAYYLELQTSNQSPRWVFVSMDAFTDDVKKIGVPVVSAGVNFQKGLKALDVYSNVPGLKTGTGLNGNIEFWPNNYAVGNSANVKGASARKYDFGDMPVEPINGYGCMQIHLTDQKQTVFAFNHWSVKDQADLGIGNSTGETLDWTFTKNISGYTKKRLMVLVK